MSTMFPHLFTPGKIGTLTLKNRIMKAPQSSGMSNLDGSVTERLVRYYRKQAAGGAGMIIVEYAYVDDIGAKSAHCHLGISNNEHIPGLSWLADNIREQGAVPAKMCIRDRSPSLPPFFCRDIMWRLSPTTRI